MNSCGGADDIDDGIDGADLMEVDLFDVYVMDFGFAGAEEFEGPDGGLSYGFCKRSGLDERVDRGEGASVMVIVALVSMGMVVRVAGFVEMLGFGMMVVLVGVLMLLMRVLVTVCPGFGWFTVFEHDDTGGGDSAAVDFFNLE